MDEWQHLRRWADTFQLIDPEFGLDHIAIDRGSLKVAFEQIIELYDALRKGKSFETVALPSISYIDFSIWHEKHLQSEGVQVEDNNESKALIPKLEKSDQYVFTALNVKLGALHIGYNAF